VDGEYGLVKLPGRAVEGSTLPKTFLQDMRLELRHGNRSIFSKVLIRKIGECLKRNEQAMLFLNRRGYSGSVSCRSCGEPVNCPHCSVPLSLHYTKRLKCHICGYERAMVEECPSCGSKLIGAFGAGTEKVEQALKELFPGIRTLRMDADTTASKDAHYKIIEAFKNGLADVLIGTQMIVKGHDFDRVTLVGILAADLSLFVPDYRSAERTFQLLTQAEGRAGRRSSEGECVIQTYNPDHYAVKCAIGQDYEAFYASECLFRREMNYPPFGSFIGMRIYGPDQEKTLEVIERIVKDLRAEFRDLEILGPAEEGPFKVRDQYRYICYLKAKDIGMILEAKQSAEELFSRMTDLRQIYQSFEN
jgi:primosomal protein N' (replication factor Y)